MGYSPAGMPTVTVVGSINLDLVATCPRLPRPGETVLATDLARYPGGKGANQALAASRAGAAVTLLGAVGDDPEADAALSLLRDSDVDLSRLITSPAPTGTALITVDERGENQIVVVPGANATLVADQVDASGADVVLCQLAAGKLDVYYEIGIQPWDWAAAALVVTEAGGVSLGIDDQHPAGSNLFLAGPPRLATDLQQLLKPQLNV